MIVFGQHAIPKSGLGVIGVAGLVRFAMVHMVGYYIDLFGNCFDHEVLGNDPPYRMAKAVRFVGAIPVKPDGPVGAHDHHTINYNGDQQIPGEVSEKKQKKEGEHSGEHQEANE